jgi:glycosyltransferase involved in cell wall biosynthesis
MKVLFQHLVPFAFAHGGQQIQIERTRAALQSLGIEVEYLRWYDDAQTGDILHFFGRIPASLLHQARQKGMKVIVADLLTEQGSRSHARLMSQKIVQRLMVRTLPPSMLAAFAWESYRLADVCVALTPWEARLMTELFGAPPQKVRIVPNGVEEVFLNGQPTQRGPWLVCTTTITQRKRVLELARAAALAQTPLWIIGKPYSESDPYVREFLQLLHPQFLRYEGPVGDRARLAQIYREARGFVLLSAMESLSLSALEAAACRCPLLLSDLPWARSVFGQSVSYCPITSSVRQTARILRSFYDAAPHLKPPPDPVTWREVAGQLKAIYESLLRPS